jgi:hypothetical protein
MLMMYSLKRMFSLLPIDEVSGPGLPTLLPSSPDTQEHDEGDQLAGLEMDIEPSRAQEQQGNDGLDQSLEAMEKRLQQLESRVRPSNLCTSNGHVADSMAVARNPVSSGSCSK